MNALKIFLFGPLVAALALSTPASADSACLKRVFNHYCLGGEAPAGAADSVQIPDAQGTVSLALADGTIRAVSREIRPANWLNYTDLKVKLVRLYGTATDASDFPRYATSRSSKLNTIRAGRGYAATRWEQSGWVVILEWRNLDHLSLRYELLENTDNQSPVNALEGL